MICLTTSRPKRHSTYIMKYTFYLFKMKNLNELYSQLVITMKSNDCTLYIIYYLYIAISIIFHTLAINCAWQQSMIIIHLPHKFFTNLKKSVSLPASHTTARFVPRLNQPTITYIKLATTLTIKQTKSNFSISSVWLAQPSLLLWNNSLY